MPLDSTNITGLFVPTTINYDVAILQQVNVNSPEFKELLVRLYQSVNSISIALNLKETGYYLTQEFVTGALLYSNTNNMDLLRPIYLTAVNFGALPSAGTKTVAHGIPNLNAQTSWLEIIGSATNPISSCPGLPLPYVSATDVAHNLELNVDATNVYITTGGHDYSAYTETTIVLRYVRFQ